MSQIESMVSAIRNSQLLRLCLLGILTVVMLIPTAMIGGLVSERQSRSVAALAEVSSKWGQAQSINGPALVLPYLVQRTETLPSGERILHTDARSAVFLPKTLRAEGRIETELRSRGIFAIPV